jgi:hypothetical protein
MRLSCRNSLEAGIGMKEDEEGAGEGEAKQENP